MRTSKQLKKVKEYMWLIQKSGIFAARIYAYINLPVDIGKRIFLKITRASNN
jgi:hypothetical protein